MQAGSSPPEFQFRLISSFNHIKIVFIDFYIEIVLDALSSSYMQLLYSQSQTMKTKIRDQPLGLLEVTNRKYIMDNFEKQNINALN